jgi:hypothetical protein
MYNVNASLKQMNFAFLSMKENYQPALQYLQKYLTEHPIGYNIKDVGLTEIGAWDFQFKGYHRMPAIYYFKQQPSHCWLLAR